jgi:DNA-binding NtrC family response regulator
LAKYFLATSNICPEKKGQIKSLTKMAVEALERHDWPGNVRELRNVIDRAIMLETTDKIGLSSIVIDDERAECGDLAGSSHLTELSLSKAERELICRALEQTCWQKTHAAALLGITRATLYAKVKQYNIKRGTYLADPGTEASQVEALAGV